MAAEMCSLLPPPSDRIMVTVRHAPVAAWKSITLHCDPHATWDDVKRAVCAREKREAGIGGSGAVAAWQHRVTGREDGVWRRHTEVVTETPLPG